MDSRIASAFSSGSILPPDPTQPDLVHLTRAMAKVAGVPRFERTTPPIERILAHLGSPQHLVFVLCDGLGLNLLRRLPADSFLVSHQRIPLRATTPSTTACALTSIATGTWPSEHGVTGWYTHVPTRGVTVTTLHMVERFTGEPLAQRGIDLRELLPIPAFHTEMRAAPLTLLPAAIAETPYARYSRGGTPVSPYRDLANASEQIRDFLSQASGSTYTHLYVPDVDSICHHHGLNDERVTALLLEIDEQLSQLAESLPKNARLVVSADHGLIEVPREAHLPLTGEDPLMAFLEAPPSGDGRMPIFHVRKGVESEFLQAFDAHFDSNFVLLSCAEAEGLGLFGPGTMSSVSRQRFGDYVGIALGPVILHYASRRAPPPQHVYLAQHAGLTPDELIIPLVVA